MNVEESQILEEHKILTLFTFKTIHNATLIYAKIFYNSDFSRIIPSYKLVFYTIKAIESCHWT